MWFTITSGRFTSRDYSSRLALHKVAVFIHSIEHGGGTSGFAAFAAELQIRTSACIVRPTFGKTVRIMNVVAYKLHSFTVNILVVLKLCATWSVKVWLRKSLRPVFSNFKDDGRPYV